MNKFCNVEDCYYNRKSKEGFRKCIVLYDKQANTSHKCTFYLKNKSFKEEVRR